MTAEAKNGMASQFINRAAAVLLLIFIAMPGTGLAQQESSCSVKAITASFEKLGSDSDSINEIQTQLNTLGLLTMDPTGDWNEGSYNALQLFCAGLESAGEPVPLVNFDNPDNKLAEFLVAGLKTGGELDDDSADCTIPELEKSFSSLKENEVRSIQELMKAGGYLTDRIDGLLGIETYNALDRLCRYMATNNLLKKAGDEEVLADILRQKLTGEDYAQTAKLLQEQTSRISIKATDDCGCSRDFDAKVYGFLPYWLADGSEQLVDFSVLDRIGFHALQLDQLTDDGKIPHKSLWGQNSATSIAKFIGAAHRHRVKVDITYYSDDWMNWKEEKISQVAEAVRRSASDTFSDTSKGTDIGPNLLDLLRKLLPFVEDRSSVGVDGINLYFDKYEEPRHASRLVQITRAVAERMPEASINIMLGLDWSASKTAAGEGIKVELFSKLKSILEIDPDAAENLNDESEANTQSARNRVVKIEKLFVFLPRNTEKDKRVTSRSKKQLRRAIEDAFDGYGQARKTVLRKTVPILPTSKSSVVEHYFDKIYEGKTGQFVDDLIYLQDNFAGVGLWPLPLSPFNDEATEIGKRLQQVYEVQDGSSLLPAPIENLAEIMCTFACPNRWLFRLTFDFLVGLLVIYAVLALGKCRLREIYQQKFLYFYGYGLVTALVFTVLVVCDPFLQDISNYVLTGIVLLLAGYLSFRYIRKSMQPKYP